MVTKVKNKSMRLQVKISIIIITRANWANYTYCATQPTTMITRCQKSINPTSETTNHPPTSTQ